MPWRRGGRGFLNRPTRPFIRKTGVASSRYVTAVLADGPIGYWRLGDTGSSAVDSSGNGTTLTYGGNRTAVTGLLTGDADKASLTNQDSAAASSSATAAAIYGLAGNFSIECWVKFSSLPGSGDQYIIQQTSAGLHFYLIRRAVSGILFGFYDTTYRETTFAVSLTTGVTYHFVATADGTNFSLYKDGSLFGQATQVGALVATTSGQPLFIGAFDSPGLNSQFPGTIDEVAVYGSALSAARIAVHYNAGIAQRPEQHLPITARRFQAAQRASRW